MSKQRTKPPSGTRDFLPQQLVRRRYVVDVIQEVYEKYGFVPLETPALENLTTLLGKYGDEGDQLIFRLLHRRDALSRALAREQVTEADLADQGLRYDLTVPLARVVAQYRELPRFFKRYQVQQVWRADRPGRGRYREFYQCDVDAIGTTSLLAEAEVCAAVAEVLRRLGFAEFSLRLNHRQLLRGLIASAGIAPELEQTALVAIDKLDKVGWPGVEEELLERQIDAQQASRLLELLQHGSGDGWDGAKRLRELLADQSGKAAIDELLQLRELLASTPAADNARFAPELARGLSYYTGPIFEIACADLGGSLGGGGRYDDLIGMFSKRTVPAVGCSLGLERIVLVLQERQMYPDLRAGPDVLLCWLDVAAADVLTVAHALRQQGLSVEIFPQSTKLGKQLQYADGNGVPVAAILGQSELAEGQLALKHLESGEQQRVPLEQARGCVDAWCAAQSEGGKRKEPTLTDLPLAQRVTEVDS